MTDTKTTGILDGAAVRKAVAAELAARDKLLSALANLRTDTAKHTELAGAEDRKRTDLVISRRDLVEQGASSAAIDTKVAESHRFSEQHEEAIKANGEAITARDNDLVQAEVSLKRAYFAAVLKQRPAIDEQVAALIDALMDAVEAWQDSYTALAVELDLKFDTGDGEWQLPLDPHPSNFHRMTGFVPDDAAVDLPAETPQIPPAAIKAAETKPEAPGPKPVGKPSMQEMTAWQQKHDSHPRKKQSIAINKG